MRFALQSLYMQLDAEQRMPLYTSTYFNWFYTAVIGCSDKTDVFGRSIVIDVKCG
jgi:hypothetical protein